MPMYDFQCSKCKTTTEKLVKSDITEVICPNCGGIADRQLSAPGGFDLQGDGWYKGNAAAPVENA